MIQDVMDDKVVWGRPTKYDPKYCQMIVDHMATGRSLEAFAGKIAVDTKTIYNWEKKHDDFFHAIKVARQRCQSYWEEQLHEGLFTDKETKFAVAGWIFKMKARFGYRDNQEVVEVAKINTAFDISKMSKEQYMEFIKNQFNKKEEE